MNCFFLNVLISDSGKFYDLTKNIPCGKKIGLDNRERLIPVSHDVDCLTKRYFPTE